MSGTYGRATGILRLYNRKKELVDVRIYEGPKRREALIQMWKYRYGKKFLELIIEEEKNKHK